MGTFGSWLLTSATWSMSRCPESKTRTKQVFRVFLSGSDFPSRSWVKLSGLPQVQEKITHVWSRSRDEEGASPKDSRQFDVQRTLAYTLGARGNGSPLCRGSPCLLVDPHILALSSSTELISLNLQGQAVGTDCKQPSGPEQSFLKLSLLARAGSLLCPMLLLSLKGPGQAEAPESSPAMASGLECTRCDRAGG